MGRLLMVSGLVLLGVGAWLTWGPRIPGLGAVGRLPGDLRFERPGVRVYVPLGTSLLLSVGLTLLLRLFGKK